MVPGVAVDLPANQSPSLERLRLSMGPDQSLLKISLQGAPGFVGVAFPRSEATSWSGLGTFICSGASPGLATTCEGSHLKIGKRRVEEPQLR